MLFCCLFILSSCDMLGPKKTKLNKKRSNQINKVKLWQFIYLYIVQRSNYRKFNLSVYLLNLNKTTYHDIQEVWFKGCFFCSNKCPIRISPAHNHQVGHPCSKINPIHSLKAIWKSATAASRKSFGTLGYQCVPGGFSCGRQAAVVPQTTHELLRGCTRDRKRQT